MSKKILVFGGPSLKPGQVTWYMSRATGRLAQIHVRAGEEVAAADIAADPPNDADGYVRRGFAQWKKETTPGRTDPAKKGKE